MTIGAATSAVTTPRPVLTSALLALLCVCGLPGRVEAAAVPVPTVSAVVAGPGLINQACVAGCLVWGVHL